MRTRIWLLVETGVRFNGKDAVYWQHVASVEEAQALSEIAKRRKKVGGTYSYDQEEPALPWGCVHPVSPKAPKASEPGSYAQGGNW